MSTEAAPSHALFAAIDRLEAEVAQDPQHRNPVAFELVVDQEYGERVVWVHWCGSHGEGGRAVGVTLPLGGHGWTLTSREPLSVSPSIICTPPVGCGTHGYIREGAWVPC